MAVFVLNKYLNLGGDLKKIEKQYMEEQIQMVKSRVNETIEYIDYNNSQTQQILEESVKERIISRVNNMRFGKYRQNYFFLLQVHDIKNEDNFATTLVNPNRPDLVGKKLPLGFKDEKDQEFIREAADQLQQKSDAVVNYWFRKLGSTKISPKTAYFRWYKDWNWIIGAGFHHDDMEVIISQRKQELGRLVMREIYLIIGVFILVTFLAILTSRFIAGKIKNEFDVFSNFFRESAKKNEFLDKNRLKFSELRELADLATLMMADIK